MGRVIQGGLELVLNVSLIPFEIFLFLKNAYGVSNANNSMIL